MAFQAAREPLESLLAQVATYEPNASLRHDAWARIAVEEALRAVQEGNIGVGGVVLRGGELVFRDHNRQFVPYFRSDLHGETVLLNRLEESLKDDSEPDMRGYTLLTSQAPCPMCLLRLVTSGVGTILFVYSDSGTPDQGSASSLDRLPPHLSRAGKTSVH